MRDGTKGPRIHLGVYLLELSVLQNMAIDWNQRLSMISQLENKVKITHKVISNDKM